MFEVTFSNTNHYWCKFVFKFESLEEAQKFIDSSMAHFIKKENEDGDLIINVSFNQRFTTEKEETNED